MAASIQAEFGVEAELVKGDAGVFDVVVDDRTIFSKDEAGRFPDNDEILAQLRS